MSNRIKVAIMVPIFLLLSSGAVVFAYNSHESLAVTTTCNPPAGLSGAENQEANVFCANYPGTLPTPATVTGLLQNDLSLAMATAILAAGNHIILESVVSDVASFNWSGDQIDYLTFNSSYHEEIDSARVCRVYNASNQLVFQSSTTTP